MGHRGLALPIDQVRGSAASRALAMGTVLGLLVAAVPAAVDAEVALWLQPRADRLLRPAGSGTSFGHDVAVSGDTMAVSSFGDVDLYVREGGAWRHQARIPLLPGGNLCCWPSLALSGDTVAIASICCIFSVGLYVRSGSAWDYQAILRASDGASGDLFGASVALDGDTLVVGAPRRDEGGAEDAGAAYVYRRAGTTWTEEAKLVSGSPSGGDLFGWSVAVRGDVVAVGAPYAASASGAVEVFERAGGAWSRKASFAGTAGEFLGHAVALGRDLLAVGAPRVVERDGDQPPGSVVTFQRTLGAWQPQARLQALDAAREDHFGLDVAMAGDALTGATVVAGAPGPWPWWDSPVRGAAYAFSGVGAVWTQQAKLQAADGGRDDGFGLAVGWSRGNAVVGAPLLENAAGDPVGSVATARSVFFAG